MKHILFSLVLLIAALPAYAGEKDKPIDLTGTWKESRRISPRKERLDFNDTTYYEFLIGNEYTIQRSGAFKYRGTYKATKTTLDFGMRMFTVLEMSNTRMVLKDEGGSYEFVRYVKVVPTENNSAAASSGRGNKADITSTRVTPEQLAGRWEVYKRTSSTTLAKIDYTQIIRVIEVKSAAGGIEGSVASARDMDGSPSWKIVRYDSSILYCTGKSDRQLKVLKCGNGELIVQEGTLTYFFKQF